MAQEDEQRIRGEAEQTGWSVLGLCASVSERPEPKTALSLSSSLGRYHELRRDRGRWVGYVREAGGNKWSQFAGTAPRKRAWTTPRRAERASRHGPETAQTLLSQRREWERSVLPLVRYNSGEPGVLRCYLAIKSAGYTRVFSNDFPFYRYLTNAQSGPTTFYRQMRENFVRFSINNIKCHT